MFSIDNRRHWGYSKGKQFNTKNEGLTDGLQVLWAGSLEAIPRSSLHKGSKGTATSTTDRKLGSRKTAPQLCSKYQETAAGSTGPAPRKCMTPPDPLSPHLTLFCIQASHECIWLIELKLLLERLLERNSEKCTLKLSSLCHTESTLRKLE